MKKYLLLIEDEKLWEEFKKSIDKDINSSIMELIKRSLQNRSNFSKRTLKKQNLAVLETANFANRNIQSSLREKSKGKGGKK